MDWQPVPSRIAALKSAKIPIFRAFFPPPISFPLNEEIISGKWKMSPKILELRSFPMRGKLVLDGALADAVGLPVAAFLLAHEFFVKSGHEILLIEIGHGFYPSAGECASRV
jgi:hypothetical protein